MSTFLKHRFAISNISISFLLSFAVGTQCTVFAQPSLSKSTSNTTATVPFIGCQSDGQVGPLEAPKGASKVVQISAQAAQQLAYYKAEQGYGVLAPRGWYCFGTYGSSGSSLYISPQPINATIVFSDNWKGFSGPVIQVSAEDGDTSGRFGVARTIARVFPSHKAYVRKVIAEGIEPASDFPSGPYPKDQLIYKNKEIVEYQTPAQTDGLGTMSRLQKNTDPIRGVAILAGPEPDLVFLAARLPSGMNDLTSVIIQQTERGATQPEN
jgi:hypothetical protein